MAENLGKVEKLETPQRRGKHAKLAEVLEAHRGGYHSAKITVPLRTLFPKKPFTSGRGRSLNSLPWAFSDREDVRFDSRPFSPGLYEENLL